MVVFDTTFLLPLFWAQVPIPLHPTTNQPVEGYRERLDYLVECLEQSRTKIIIPTPALSELLVRAGTAGPEYLEHISSQAVFRTVAFDERAAVEVAAMTKKAIDADDKRGGVDATWNKIKYDRQIVGIAKVEGASVLYSDDSGVRTFGVGEGLTVISCWELALPPQDPQASLELTSAQSATETASQPDDPQEAQTSKPS